MTHKKNAIPLLCAVAFALQGCGDDVFLSDAIRTTGAAGSIVSGDIIIVSGGTVARTASPYPLHSVSVFSEDGIYKSQLHAAASTELLWGASLNANGTGLLIGVDTVDRVDLLDLYSMNLTSFLLDANLSGTTIRSVGVLSDGSTLVAESTTTIEKFDSGNSRVSTSGFPTTIATNSITAITPISGNRFVVSHIGTADDRPKIYNNSSGVSTGQIGGAACNTACDPVATVELSDGRFVTANVTTNSLEIFSSTFVWQARLYSDPTVLLTPSAMAVLRNGNILVCNSGFDTCEEFSVSGTTATRVGSHALIADPSVVRDPTAVVVVP